MVRKSDAKFELTAHHGTRYVAAMVDPQHLISAEERLAWLRLIRSENVGPVTFFQLLAHFGTASAALNALPELARRGGRAGPIKVCPKSDAVREIEAHEAMGARLIAHSDPEYPPLLAEISDAPPVLSLHGHGHLLERNAVAIVGARNASANGRRMAQTLAAGLGQHDLVVPSGMARGIDAAAHTGALEGGTIAVMAGGVDVIYPTENTELYQDIVERGAVISEQPLGTKPLARHFPPRNRLISGLSLAVVVVEAARRSGSLITARLAGEQGREVLAVPGSPLDPRAQGTNLLIREGATLIQSAEDVVEALGGMLRRPAEEGRKRPLKAAPSTAMPDESELARARAKIIESLGPSPVTVDEIIRQCQFSPAVVSAILLELELAGRLERQPGGQICLFMRD